MNDLEGGRYELKYCLPLRARPAVLRALEGHARPDRHAGFLEEIAPPDLRPFLEGARGYRVRSLYFDTPQLWDYRQRLDEARSRHRIRVRTYGDAGEGGRVFLEDKRKWDDRVVKARVGLGSGDDWVRDAAAEPWKSRLGQVASPFLRHFDRLVAEGRRRPVAVVSYLREAFVAVAGGPRSGRLSLDFRVRAARPEGAWDLFAAGSLDLLAGDHMVLELKFEGSKPAWMRRLVRELGLRAESISKANLSIACLVRASDREIRYHTPRQLRPPLRESA